MWWTWLAGCATPAVDPAHEPPAPAGEAPACASCHAAEHAAWEGSHHARAERELGPADGWAKALGGVRVIGVDPLMQALVPGEGGRLQAHDQAFDPRDGSRFPLFTDGRAAGDWGGWTGGGNTWNSRCGACHTTGFAKGLQPDGTYASSFAALGVTCAACHGDAELHARGGPPPVNARMEDTCEACHSLRGEIGDGWEPGDALLDGFLPTLLDDPAFGPDGRSLGETFASNQFAASAMHAGGVRCADCHDSHSGALLHVGDALCDRCHTALGPAPEHAAHTPPLACVDCHMPTTTVMQRHARRDHGFTSPRQGASADACADCHAARPATASADPEVEAFARARDGIGWDGLKLDTPNPALRAAYHATLAEWPEDGRAREALRAGIQDADHRVRFAAAGALSPREPIDVVALERGAEDPVRAVRVAAQRSLARGGDAIGADYGAMLAHNADDPRMRAERGSVRAALGDLEGLADLRAALAMDPGNPDFTVQLAVGLSRAGRPADALRALESADAPDHAGLQEALGLALGLAGRPEEGIAALERAIARDPTREVSWRNLALLRFTAGRTDAARQAAAEAIRLNPNDEGFAAWAESLK